MSFTPGIPSSGQTLGNSRLQVLNNFASLRTTLAQNHIDVNAAGAGKHSFVQLVNQLTIPGGLSGGDETLYSKLDPSNAGQIYFTRGATGVEIQLTGPGNPKSLAPLATNYSFLPGGFVIQWGTIVQAFASHTTYTNSITYSSIVGNIAFVNNTAIVIGTLTSSGGPSSDCTLSFEIVDKTKFNWCVTNNGSNKYTGFQWVAIGF